MAPEYLTGGIVSNKADIFSLGVVIIEIVTGRRDYPNSVTYLQHFNQNDSFESTDMPFEHFKENVRLSTQALAYVSEIFTIYFQFF